MTEITRTITIALGAAQVRIGDIELTGSASVSLPLNDHTLALLTAGAPDRRNVALPAYLADYDQGELREIVSKTAREAGAELGLSPASIYRLRQQLTTTTARDPKARIANLERHLAEIGHDRARSIIGAADTLEHAAVALDIGYTTIYKAMKILGIDRADRSAYRPDPRTAKVIEGVAGTSMSFSVPAIEANQVTPAPGWKAAAVRRELANASPSDVTALRGHEQALGRSRPVSRRKSPKHTRVGRVDRFLAERHTDDDLRVIIGAARSLKEAAGIFGIGASSLYPVMARLGIDPRNRGGAVS